MKKIIFFVLSTVFVLFIPNVVNAMTPSISVEWYRDVVFGGKNKQVYPLGNQSGAINVNFDNLNQTIYCATDNCIVEYYYNASFNSTSQAEYNFNILAVSGQLDANGYPVCSVNDSNISCLVPNGLNIRGLSLYFPYADINTNWALNVNLLGTYAIYNLSNSLSGLINAQQQTTNAVNNVNDSINNDSVSSNSEHSNTAQGWASNNASDSVVSDMVLMPITLLNAFSIGFNGSCQAYNLGSLFGTDLILPCINISNYLGATLWGIIDVLMSGFLIYGIGKKFVRVFNDFTNLKDSQVDELYGGGNE